MILSDFLESKSEEIINNAVFALSKSNLKHYSDSVEVENRDKLTKLFELVLKSMRIKNLIPVVEYSGKIAAERYYSGFDYHEVHTAFSILEENIWKKIIAYIKTPDIVDALSITSTILGAAKETLANTYISLSGRFKVRSIDVSGLYGRC